MCVRPVVVGVVVVVLVSLLGGCSLFKDDPQTQLDKIIAKTGATEVVSISLIGNERNVRRGTAHVVVAIVKDDIVKKIGIDGDKLTESGESFRDFATTPVSVDKFSIDFLSQKAERLVNPEFCELVSVSSVLTPAGSVGTWVECTGRGGGQQHVVDEQSMLDGGLFYVPRIDPQVAADLDVLKQAYVTVMGTSKVHRFSYYFNQALLSLDGPVTTNALGESCVPSMTALLSSSSTPFPVSCDTKATVGSNPFDVNEFSSTSVAEVVASVENSQILDYQSLVSITFFHQGEDLCWEVTTTSIGDLSAHRDQLKGCITKGA